MIEYFKEWFDESVTHVTQAKNDGLQNNSLETNDVTRVTHVTHENGNHEVNEPSVDAEELSLHELRPSTENRVTPGYTGYTADSQEPSSVTHDDINRVTQVTDQELEAMQRLEAAGICIAIDKATGSALLVFTQSDADAVCHVADIYQPFEIRLTAQQQSELLNDLDYYYDILKRRGKNR
jgi:hypothetical protein